MILHWLTTNGVIILFILIGAFLVRKIAFYFVGKFVFGFKRHQAKESGLKRKNTLTKIINNTLSVIVILIAGLMILREFGVDVGPILAAAGIVGIALGFGAQYLVRDVITGLFIILENQYRIGDVVCFDATCGTVEDITLRMTSLRDMDGTVHHVPHGEIKKVSNLTKFYAKVNLNMSIAYDSDLEKVITVVNKVGKELAEDPNWKTVITKAPQFLRVDDFADSAIIIKITGETKSTKQWDVTGELRKRLKIAFDKEGIEIPFPQIVVREVSKNS